MKPLPALKIGNFEAKIPIIQGGMAVGVSRADLASAVARAGAIGIIATAAIGLISDHYHDRTDYFQANIQALREELAKARAQAPHGIIGTNCMVAVTDYEAMVRTSAEGGANLIISGAGLPLRLPEYARDFPDVVLAPIVSSVKAARVLVERWDKRYGRLPDAFVVETPNEAGGHLGTKREHLGEEGYSLEAVIPDLVQYLDDQVGERIPVIAAGGIWDRADIDRMLALGASGVQMATRFACTHECDVAPEFKQAYIDSTPEDIVIVDSPVGLPGRAVKNVFLERVDSNGDPTKCLANCLKRCFHKEGKGSFCIARALRNAAVGDLDNGLVFAGSNAHRCDRLVSVEELLSELTS